MNVESGLQIVTFPANPFQSLFCAECRHTGTVSATFLANNRNLSISFSCEQKC